MTHGLVLRFRRFKRLLYELDDTTDAEHEVFDIVGRNADIEAFAMHCRNLIEFLFYAPKGNYCRAHDYTSTWPTNRSKPSVLAQAVTRAENEIVHLGWNRHAPARDWGYDAIWESLSDELRDFIDKAEQERLGTENREALDQLLNSERPADDTPVLSAIEDSPFPEYGRPFRTNSANTLGFAATAPPTSGAPR